ncbi:hypothetical protein Ddc_10811 [Ditylenchus destructor]|nr:hypothetical protein Ddc_10811 [Ditylenchus destructor]
MNTEALSSKPRAILKNGLSFKLLGKESPQAYQMERCMAVPLISSLQGFLSTERVDGEQENLREVVSIDKIEMWTRNGGET